jgi:hypothetical protein
MSIGPILQRLLDDKLLFELPSLFTGYETACTMIVSPEILAVVSPPFSDDVRGTRLAEFRQWLDAFSEGAQITIADNPKDKPPDAMMARVDPVEADFFSIRVTDPAQTPGIRSLGAFADKDKFVALLWDFREDIQDFDDEVAAVRDAWKGMFGSEEPHSGEHLDDYYSNCIPV